METSVQCYMVRAMVSPSLLGRSYVETYFLAQSDGDAVQDSFRHAVALGEIYSLWVERIEVFACHLGVMLAGVSQGGIDRLLFDSDNLEDSIIKEKPDFVG